MNRPSEEEPPPSTRDHLVRLPLPPSPPPPPPLSLGYGSDLRQPMSRFADDRAETSVP